MAKIDDIKKLAPEGSKVEYLGKYVGLDAYQAYFPEQDTGFPFVYIVNGEQIREINGFDALDIVTELIKEE